VTPQDTAPHCAGADGNAPPEQHWADGRTTVETDMDPDDGTTGAVLLATIALVWRVKPFHLQSQVDA
jgi:hypothetical protein